VELIAARWRSWISANPALEREWALDRGRAGHGRFGEARRWTGTLALLLLYGVGAWWLTRPDRDAWQARGFLLVASLAALLLVTLVVPGIAAASVVLERERRSWQELLLTRLAPGQLVAAKFIAGGRPAGRLLLGVLPLLVMGAHAGALPLDHFLELLLVLVAASAAILALSLSLGGRFRRTLTAVPVAYLLCGLLFWATVVPFPALAVRGENLWWYLSPAWHVALLCLAEPGPSPLARPLLPEWLWFVLGAAMLTIAALAALSRRIAREEQP
jgi:ABC-type Na+ efflux pump permease subunit